MDVWAKYEKCKNHADSINLLARTNENWDFYLGNQWNIGVNTPLTDKSLPVINIIKSSVKYRVSTIAQNAMIPTFNERSGDPVKGLVAEMLNVKLQKDWKLSKQKQKSWKIIKHGMIQGDSYQYCGTSDPRDDQIIHNTNIFFGDESNTCIQEQPYVIIRERLLVEDVRKIAKENGLPKNKIDDIQADGDDSYLIGDATAEDDIEDKVTSLLYFEKRNGTVWFGRYVKGVEYQPMKPMETKRGDTVVRSRTLYPVASFICEEQPNDARGLSAVHEMIANQMSINKNMARREEATKQYAFPKGVYDANRIRNAEDLGKAGTWIAVDGVTESVKGLIDYINPMSQSPDAQALQNDLIQLTRETSGSNDALTGATDPTRVSGAAVIAMRDQTALPLNENVDNFKQFIEDLANIWLEATLVQNPDGIMVDDKFIPAEDLEGLDIKIDIDVSQDTPWTRNAEQAFLDNLLTQNRITLEQYVELSPDHSVVPKGKMRKMFASMAGKPVVPQGGINETPM